MFKKGSRLKVAVWFLCVMMILPVVPAPDNGGQAAYAASVSTFSSSAQEIVCGKQAKIKLPSGYTNCTFSSSNKKVATVTSKGVVKAVRLGVADITAKSGSQKKVYTITVKPAKASEVWLNQEAVISNQKLQFKLESDKYDTSQVSLRFLSAYSAIDNKGKCTGIKLASGYMGYGFMYYSYGSFSKSIDLEVYSPEWIMNGVMGQIEYANTPYAIKISSSKNDISPSRLRKRGISLKLDGKAMPNKVTLKPGKHVISLVAGKKKYASEEISVPYTIREALEKRNATGFQQDRKKVLDKVFEVLDEIITDDMSDRDKVKAIHDYLIFHADYYKNGDLSNVEGWAYSISGVLLHGEGVCESYALTFYTMATIEGIPCKYVGGYARTGRHGWNRVQLDGKWYYIDCTWDDPVGGGHEGYNYYLSETLWPDHTEEVQEDLCAKGNYFWDHYYLTGEMW